MMDPKRLPAFLGGFCLLLAAALSLGRVPSCGGGDWFRQARRAEHLAAEQQALEQSVAAGRGIVTDLVEGRLSLREAADALRDEHETRPPHHQPKYELYAGEDYLQATLRLAESRLADSPRREEVLRRLRAELQTYQTASSLPSPRP